MKAVICGAGIAGLALAQRLDAHGWDVVVLEKSSGPRTQGYMIDFFGSGYDAAESMGVLPRLRELGYQIAEATYVDESGRRRAALDYEQFARVTRGRLLSIMRPDLEQALRERLSDDVDLRFGSSLTQVDNRADGVRVTLSDGHHVDADLLVGADGIHSTVRRSVFGAEQRYFRYLGFHTAAFAFEDPEVHAELRNRFVLTDTVGRQLGCYGLRDGRVAVFTVHRTPDPTLPTDIRTTIRREYASLGWIPQRVLANCPPDTEIYYDQVAQIEMQRWSRGRVTLVGDACHAVSLLAGQGASLGIAGAYVLADQLSRSDSIDAALDQYERLWRPVALEKQQVGRNGAGWFLPASRWRLRARRLALKLTHLPGLTRFIGGAVIGKPTTVLQELDRARKVRS